MYSRMHELTLRAARPVDEARLRHIAAIGAAPPKEGGAAVVAAKRRRPRWWPLVLVRRGLH
ncbi:MAG: hypothetical protein ACJ762_15100 [Solirubrobacteraceae bacterium]